MKLVNFNVNLLIIYNNLVLTSNKVVESPTKYVILQSDYFGDTLRVPKIWCVNSMPCGRGMWLVNHLSE